MFLRNNLYRLRPGASQRKWSTKRKERQLVRGFCLLEIAGLVWCLLVAAADTGIQSDGVRSPSERPRRKAQRMWQSVGWVPSLPVCSKTLQLLTTPTLEPQPPGERHAPLGPASALTWRDGSPLNAPSFPCSPLKNWIIYRWRSHWERAVPVSSFRDSITWWVLWEEVNEMGNN